MAFDETALENMRGEVRIYGNKALLARQLGVSRATLYNFIGGMVPDVTFLNSLCRLLKLDPETGLSIGTFINSHRHPYSMTESQVDVLKAMTEQRYLDVIQIVTDIMQGKRPD